MNQYSDQFLAKQLLEMREHGFTFVRFMRRNLILHLFFALSILLILLLGAWSGNRLAFGLALGFFLGFWTFTITTIRGVNKHLPFRLKVTDWDKVQRLADGQDVA